MPQTFNRLHSLWCRPIHTVYIHTEWSRFCLKLCEILTDLSNFQCETQRISPHLKYVAALLVKLLIRSNIMQI